MCTRFRTIALAASIAYVSVCALFGLLYCADMAAILDAGPGDSMMAFDAFSHLAGIAWWSVWMTAAVVLQLVHRERPKLCDLLACFVVASLVAVGISRTPSLFSFPAGSFMSVGWVFVNCAMPALGAVPVGVCIARRSFGKPLSLLSRAAVISVLSLWAGTFLWWPKEMLMSIAGLTSVRGFPGDWTEPLFLARLNLTLGLGVITIVVIAFGLFLGRGARRS